MAQYRLIVNGKEEAVEADAEMPLLWVLRDLLNLRGTKFGCGMGICGACTIHLNGSVARSCVTTVSSVHGQKISTIEGLSEDGTHPLQMAWDEIDVPQCGYCQAGQLMMAAFLLSQNSAPTDEQIEQTMSGNICRCGTYHRIRQAVRRACELKRNKA